MCVCIYIYICIQAILTEMALIRLAPKLSASDIKLATLRGWPNTKNSIATCIYIYIYT